MNYVNKDGDTDISKLLKHIGIGLVVLIVLFGSFGTVGAGERGLKLRFGKVRGIIQSGLYFKLPLIESVISLDVQTQKEQTDAEAASKDLQTVHTTVAVNYNIDSTKVSELYVNVGTEYGTKIIDPAVQEVVKAITAKYTAEELITKREQVRSEIQSELSNKLSANQIQVTAVSIVHFDFSKSFNDAIEMKVTAEQNALAAKNKLDQVKYEAEQRISQAKGEAEAIRIQAQAIQQQGGAEYVNLKAVEKWNGNLPTYMMSGGSVPFINIK